MVLTAFLDLLTVVGWLALLSTYRKDLRRHAVVDHGYQVLETLSPLDRRLGDELGILTDGGKQKNSSLCTNASGGPCA